ncbi:hypothetical protein NEHOM01_0196 [Nematocida homosporus]|uniref:uncharacterized protein n=1 Tax=Nematocida homosporus TaxID=1912981 RepID=UPI00221EF85E|nr:uncharacterized protein NEHOM01_0196 [Nematocida homosporus]KAI5184521.1 hypothetical protein NEHOM01_0196 [Nematocida homosporus]
MQDMVSTQKILVVKSLNTRMNNWTRWIAITTWTCLFLLVCLIPRSSAFQKDVIRNGSIIGAADFLSIPFVANTIENGDSVLAKEVCYFVAIKTRSRNGTGAYFICLGGVSHKVLAKLAKNISIYGYSNYAPVNDDLLYKYSVEYPLANAGRTLSQSFVIQTNDALSHYLIRHEGTSHVVSSTQSNSNPPQPFGYAKQPTANNSTILQTGLVNQSMNAPSTFGCLTLTASNSTAPSKPSPPSPKTSPTLNQTGNANYIGQSNVAPNWLGISSNTYHQPSALSTTPRPSLANPILTQPLSSPPPPTIPITQPPQYTLPAVPPTMQLPQSTLPAVPPVPQPPQYTLPTIPITQPPQSTLPAVPPVPQPPQSTLPTTPITQPPQSTLPTIPTIQPPQSTSTQQAAKPFAEKANYVTVPESNVATVVKQQRTPVPSKNGNNPDSFSQGLPNVGQSCYFNSAVQIIASFPEIQAILLNIVKPSLTNQNIDNSLQHEPKLKRTLSGFINIYEWMIAAPNSNHQSDQKIRKVLVGAIEDMDIAAINETGDAKEVVLKFFNNLEKYLTAASVVTKENQYEVALQSLRSLFLMDTTETLSLGQNSVPVPNQQDKYYTPILSVKTSPNTSDVQSLAQLISEKVCKQTQKHGSQSTYAILTLPKYIMIEINCLTVTPSANTSHPPTITKYTKHINIDQTLNSNHLLFEPVSTPVEYKIKGFITHFGRTMNTGHYVSYCKRNGEWAIYNDLNVDHSIEIDKHPTMVKQSTVCESTSYETPCFIVYEAESV